MTNKRRLRIGVYWLSQALKRRYPGRGIGVWWIVLAPLVLVTIYTSVLTGVMGLRWGMEEHAPVYFGLMVLIGVAYYQAFSECLIRASGLIHEKANLARKVKVPWEVLPFVLLGEVALPLICNLIVILVGLGITGVLHPVGVFYLPVIILPFFLLLAGCAALNSVLGVFFRDLGQLMNFLSMALLFMSPVFFSMDIVPESLRQLMLVSPLTIPVEMTRIALTDGELNTVWLLLLWTLSSVVFMAGMLIFRLTRESFADGF
ncbi:MAG: ABC transporter permease [Pseudomonadales bacterium]|nr:ABC transporter permease [Pseudomonadales bacterium]